MAEGVCGLCKQPIMIFTGENRLICPECEKKINTKIRKNWKERGKNTKKKRLIFPKLSSA